MENKMKRPTILFCIALGFSPRILTAAPILGDIKTDHFGYRTSDSKVILFTKNPGSSVGIYNASTSVLASTASPVSQGTDTGAAGATFSGDTVWSADFSSITTPGSYYIYSSALNEQSYNFQISDCIYQAPMSATLKAFYYQRCGTAKPAAYAGTNWSDSASCHTGDASCGPASGCSFPMAYGTLNLSGGWHDAGDYNKYIGTDTCAGWGGDGGSALHYLLTAYEWNPSLFSGFQSNIPESGNGIPDILNEAKWELDWYLKMQMTDKHVLSVVHQTFYTTGSPPSTDATTRYYYPPNPPGEAEFVAVVSNAARVMNGIPALSSYAATLKGAAEATWNAYVSSEPVTDVQFWAAAEIFRMEKALGGPASISSKAQSIVDNYFGSISSWLNENQDTRNWGILAYIQAAGATSAVVTNMKTSWGGLVGDIFSQDDLYHSGMHNWDYFWGANQVKMDYGMELVWGAKLGATGTYSAAQCLQHAEDYIHYMDGLNPINMVYMTNSNALGAPHGIWRIYHSWFGNYGVAFSFNNFIGKPASVVDPLYPYFSGTDNFGINDSGPSSFGPPPGIVPDGASDGYASGGGISQPPMLSGNVEPPYEKEYRDWDWVDPTGSQSVPWIVNETGIYYTGSYMALSSVFAVSCPAGTPTPTGTPTFSPTITKTSTLSPTKTPTLTPSASLTATMSPTGTWTPTAMYTSTFTHTLTVTPTITPPSTSTLTPTATLTGTPTASSTGTLPTATNTQTLTPTKTATSTGTATATPTHSNTSTMTNTPSLTLTASPTRTFTSTPIATSTFSSTATGTPTSAPTPGSSSGLYIYPNPADGTQPVVLQIHLASTSQVQVRLFTTAFRRVREELMPHQSVGVPILLDLNDDSGSPLASGLYYVVVDTNLGRSIGKLLVLR